MIERPVALVCTGYGTHRVCELVVLVPVHGQPSIDLMRMAEGMPPRTPSADEQRGFAVAGSSRMYEPGMKGWREHHKTEARLVNPPGIGWRVEAPGCPRCGDSMLRVPVAGVAAYVGEHFPPGPGRVDVDMRPPRDSV